MKNYRRIVLQLPPPLYFHKLPETKVFKENYPQEYLRIWGQKTAVLPTFWFNLVRFHYHCNSTWKYFPIKLATLQKRPHFFPSLTQTYAQLSFYLWELYPPATHISSSVKTLNNYRWENGSILAKISMMTFWLDLILADLSDFSLTNWQSHMERRRTSWSAPNKRYLKLPSICQNSFE